MDRPIDDPRQELAFLLANTPAEEAYRTVHRWIDARRANRSADEMALRKTLQADHPVLFRYLKRSL